MKGSNLLIATGFGLAISLSTTLSGYGFFQPGAHGPTATPGALSGSAISPAAYYGSFGEPIRAAGPMAKANPFRFSTKYQDDESALVYYGYRYYNASTGRWLSRDPIEEHGGFNLYAFPGNDAIDRWDIAGLAGLSDSEKKCCKCLVFAEGGSDEACQQAVLMVLASRQLYSKAPPGEKNPFPSSKNEGGFCDQSKKTGTFTGANTDKYRYCMGEKCKKEPTKTEKKLYDQQIATASKACDGLPNLEIPAGSYYWWNPDLAPTNERIMQWNIKIGNCVEIPTGCKSIKVYACNSEMKPEGTK
ncbi:MAG TPA: RHS repeat-associated core domain-containing protein [Verrucomicrobiae bacterium]